MKDVEMKLAKSLTAKTTELIPYLPYILQDLWDLGSSPNDIIEMISKHIEVSESTKVLDLACGKGAVSINLAKTLSLNITGIDIMGEFIDYANKKAKEYAVETLCDFIAGDVNEAVKVKKGYDIVIFGAAGDVLGNAEETIQKLKKTVKKNRYIFIDDAYGKDECDTLYLTREKWLEVFKKTGVRLIDEKVIDENELKSINEKQQISIIKRANELKQKYPEKVHLFDSYIKSQQDECDELENEISGVTMLLQVI